jgi:hypothetical protein
VALRQHARPGQPVVHRHPVGPAGAQPRQGPQFAEPGRRPPGAPHLGQVAAQRQGRGDRGEPRLDRGHRLVLQGGDDETARAEEVKGQFDDTLLAAGVLDIQVADGLPGDQGHDVGHPRHLVASHFAQPGVTDPG